MADCISKMDPRLLLRTARVVSRYCLPQANSDLPHVTLQLDAFLDTFSADWTIIKAYKHTESLRFVQYIAARESSETQDPFYKRWLLNRTAELAASRGDLKTLQWLMEIYLPVQPVDNVVEVAAAFGHLDLLRWIYDHHLNRVHFGGSEMCRPLERKHEHVVNWLREHAVPATGFHEKVLRSAAKGGNLNVVKWLCEEFGLDATKLLQVTINGCNWETARWIIERFDIFGADIDLYYPTRHGELWFLKYVASRNMKHSRRPIMVAALFGHLDIIKWLYWDEVRVTDVMIQAAQNGHLNVMQWLCNAKDDVFTSGETLLAAVFLRAAEYGHLDVLQWLHTHWRGNCGVRLIDFAASGGHFDVIKWLHENRTEGCSERAMDRAAANGHFDVVKYLHEHRSEGCTVDAMDNAARGGCLEIVKWLNDHRSEGCSMVAMDFAAQNGHLNVVQWLHTNRKEGCTSLAMDGAIENGHLDIVKWLHENRSEGCTSSAVTEAAKHGHLDIVKWLYDHRSARFASSAMTIAAAYGHLDVVKWLHRKCSEGSSNNAMESAITFRHFDVVLFLHLHSNVKFDLPTGRTVKLPIELQQWVLTNYADKVSSWQFEVHKIELEILWH